MKKLQNSKKRLRKVRLTDLDEVATLALLTAYYELK